MSHPPAVSTLRLRLLSIAADVLARLRRAPPEPIEVRVERHDCVLTLGVAPVVRDGEALREARVAELAPFLLSPLELSVVQLLRRQGRPVSSKQIAAQCAATDPNGYPSTKLRILLANLVERGMIENTDDGYLLAPPFVAVANALLPPVE